MDADTEDHPGRDQRGGVGPVAPATAHDSRQRQEEKHEPGDDEPARHHVVTGGRRRGRVGIAHVEQPVAQAPPDLRCRRREAHRLQRLRVGQHVGATAALDHQHRDPPERHAEREPADLHRRRCGPAPRDLPLRRGDDQPQQRRRHDHHQRGGVDCPDGEYDKGGDRGIAPAGARRRADGQPDDPAQPGPREEHRRRPRDVRQDVRRELVEDRGGERGGEPETEFAGGPQHAGSGGEEQRAQPQAMGDPVRESGVLTEPEPRPMRPQVGDHLVGDPAGELAGIEGERGIADEAPRIQIEVELGVGRHPAGRRRQCRHVGEQGERADRQPWAVPLNEPHQRARGRKPVRCSISVRTPARAGRRCGDEPAST